jgi:hypothetical protein
MKGEVNLYLNVDYWSILQGGSNMTGTDLKKNIFIKVAQMLRSAACLHKNQSRSYLNHLVSANVRCGHTSPFIYTNIHILCLKLSVFRHCMKHPNQKVKRLQPKIKQHRQRCRLAYKTHIKILMGKNIYVV